MECSWELRPDRHVAKQRPRESSPHRLNRRVELEQQCRCEIEGMLVGLIDGSDWVVLERRSLLLDVCAEDVRDAMPTDEVGEP
jgi:hypothetical protein